jgi:hypothetical protein
MTAITDKQYRPVSNIETAVNDGLSVRYCQDMAANINNYHIRVGNYKIWSDFFFPHQDGPAANDFDETVLRYLGKHYIPDGCNKLRIYGSGVRTAGTTEVQFRVYSSTNLYVGSSTFDSTILQNSASVTLVFDDTGNKEIETHALTIDATDSNGYIFLLLTGQNESGDATTEGDIYSMDIQLEY